MARRWPPRCTRPKPSPPLLWRTSSACRDTCRSAPSPWQPCTSSRVENRHRCCRLPASLDRVPPWPTCVRLLVLKVDSSHSFTLEKKKKKSFNTYKVFFAPICNQRRPLLVPAVGLQGEACPAETPGRGLANETLGKGLSEAWQKRPSISTVVLAIVRTVQSPGLRLRVLLGHRVSPYGPANRPTCCWNLTCGVSSKWTADLPPHRSRGRCLA